MHLDCLMFWGSNWKQSSGMRYNLNLTRKTAGLLFRFSCINSWKQVRFCFTIFFFSIIYPLGKAALLTDGRAHILSVKLRASGTVGKDSFPWKCKLFLLLLLLLLYVCSLASNTEKTLMLKNLESLNNLLKQCSCLRMKNCLISLIT